MVIPSVPTFNAQTFLRGNGINSLAVDGGSGGGGTPPSGGTEADAIALAETIGYGYYSVSDPSQYVAGNAADTFYQLLDLTTSQHTGTLSQAQGAAATNLAKVSDGKWTQAQGTTERMYMVEPNFPFSLTLIQIIQYPDGGSPTNAYPMMWSTSTSNRPYVRVGGAGLEWVINGWNGGSSDEIQNAEGDNVDTPVHVADGDIHCILMHWGDQASEGLILDMDGFPLIPNNTSISVADQPVAPFFGTQVANFLDRQDTKNATYTNNNTVHRYGLAWLPVASRNTVTHAQSRSLARAMMAAYGVTDLTP